LVKRKSGLDDEVKLIDNPVYSIQLNEIENKFVDFKISSHYSPASEPVVN
jgi:hypothetical protein